MLSIIDESPAEYMHNLIKWAHARTGALLANGGIPVHHSKYNQKKKRFMVRQRTHKPVTQEDRSRIIDLWMNTPKSKSEISYEVNRGEYMIQDVLKKAGLPTRKVEVLK